MVTSYKSEKCIWIIIKTTFSRDNHLTRFEKERSQNNDSKGSRGEHSQIYTIFTEVTINKKKQRRNEA